jgi:glycosyltransferase involved in cell wall biosynthesis
MKEPIKKIIKNFGKAFGLEIRRYNPKFKQEPIVTLETDKIFQGNVLLGYIIDPFLLKGEESIPNSHTHFIESLLMAETFLNLGYSVDVISYLNKGFFPKKKYSVFVAARTNFQRIAELLNEDCLKVVHLDTSHWLFNNSASYNRCFALQERRGVSLKSFKWVEANWAIEQADYATVLGNDITISTYRYAQKPIVPLCVPTFTVYPWGEGKNFDDCRNHFLWLGSDGLVHKGLDLVLEAFAEMPQYRLTVCGPVREEKGFESCYYKELYHTPNIRTIGWVDITSPEFLEIATDCLGLIYPSCAEGQSGAVATCLQAGLIPIISRESGFDVDDFGLILRECSIDEIKNSIRKVSGLSAEELESMALKAWEYARANHTRKSYAREYRKAVAKFITEYENNKMAIAQ